MLILIKYILFFSIHVTLIHGDETVSQNLNCYHFTDQLNLFDAEDLISENNFSPLKQIQSNGFTFVKFKEDLYGKSIFKNILPNLLKRLPLNLIDVPPPF